MIAIEALYSIFLQHPTICTDTRKLSKGCLYFALKGEKFNGNLFAQQALEAGAAFVIIDETQDTPNEYTILVDDVLKTLQQLALHHRKTFSIPFIAITGSNGKTTTKELIAAVLSKKYKTQYTQGNLNNHIGVPLTLLSIKKDTEIAIIEMGANHQGEISSYCLYSEPTHGLINNVGKAHLEGFGGLEGVKKGKGELYRYLLQHDGIVFRNTDLEYLKEMAQGAAHQITYGSTADATYKYLPLTQETFASVAVLNAMNECTVHSQLVGSYNIPNLMAAITLGLYFDVPIEAIQKAIEQYAPDNSRSQLMQKGGNTIILDAYNANPTSMKAAIKNFEQLPASNKLVWIGAMKEMGAASEEEHKLLIQLLQNHEWQQVMLVGPEFKGIAHDYLWFETSTQAKEFLQQQLPMNSTILIKGSRGSKMEVLLELWN